MLGYYLSHAQVLWRWPPGFADGRVVVVTGQLRTVRRRIRTCPETESRTAMDHVEIERGLVFDHPADVALDHGDTFAVMRLTPPVKPPGEILSAEQWSLGVNLAQHA